MLFDSLEFETPRTIDCDVCIVGSGAAGISIARQLISSPFRVALVESGHFRRDKRTQNLYDGMTEVHFEPNDNPPSSRNHYLGHSRLRYFGGTTNHWGGRCRPLDEFDFKSRSWVPNSGWPLSRQVLLNYYQEASNILRINAFDLKQASGISLPNNYHQILNDTDFIFTNFYRFSRPPVQFGKVYRKELLDAANINIYLNANVSRINLNESGERVTELLFSTFVGVEHLVRAKSYILATGAIENARLLLLSDNIQQTGIGNQYDNVGRYFMEHAEYENTSNCMVFESSELFDWHKLREKDGRFFLPVLCPTPKAQEKYEILNAAIELDPYADQSLSKEVSPVLSAFLCV